MGIPEPLAPGVTAPVYKAPGVAAPVYKAPGVTAPAYRAPGAFGSTAPLGTGSLGPPASSFVKRPGRPRTGKRPILKD